METFEAPESAIVGEVANTAGIAKSRISRVKNISAGHATAVPMCDAAKTSEAKSGKTAPPKAVATKSDAVLKLLRSTKGATIEVIMQTTGWQAHSVRGFLSAVVKKKLALNLASEISKDGQRRYRISDVAQAI